jgi:hypothetical protein
LNKWVLIKNANTDKCLTHEESSIKLKDCNENDDFQIWKILVYNLKSGQMVLLFNKKTAKVMTNINDELKKLKKCAQIKKSKALLNLN